MLDVPPCTAARSSTSTDAPARAASSAAHPPAMPKPTTTTSYDGASAGRSVAGMTAGTAVPLELMAANLEQVSVSCDPDQHADPDRRGRPRAPAAHLGRLRARRGPH